MKSRFNAFILIAAMLISGGCDLIDKLNNKKDGDSSTPTSPSTGTSLDAFAGTWSSVTASTPPAGCGNVKYTVTPTTSSSAAVTFTGTCAGNINVTGSGAGTLNGSAVDWSASGVVAQGGVNCPFTFTNSKATLNAAGQVVVTYAGTVCGIPVSGTETAKK